MLAETLLTSNSQIHQQLKEQSLRVEMADAHEGIVRDNKTEDFFLVYVEPMPDGETLQTACSCDEGTKDIACTHALRVIRRIRADAVLLAQALRQEQPDTEAETVC